MNLQVRSYHSLPIEGHIFEARPAPTPSYCRHRDLSEPEAPMNMIESFNVLEPLR